MFGKQTLPFYADKFLREKGTFFTHTGPFYNVSLSSWEELYRSLDFDYLWFKIILIPNPCFGMAYSASLQEYSTKLCLLTLNFIYSAIPSYLFSNSLKNLQVNEELKHVIYNVAELRLLYFTQVAEPRVGGGDDLCGCISIITLREFTVQREHA